MEGQFDNVTGVALSENYQSTHEQRDCNLNRTH